MPELYQLRSSTRKCNGDFFLIDGPHDRNGFVMSSTKIEDGEHKGKWLNQVRGTGNDVVPKNQVNDYIRNGFNISPKKDEIKRQKSIKGNSFKVVKQLADASQNGFIRLPKGHSGAWSHYKVIANGQNEVTIQRNVTLTNNPIIVIYK